MTSWREVSVPPGRLRSAAESFSAAAATARSGGRPACVPPAALGPPGVATAVQRVDSALAGHRVAVAAGLGEVERCLRGAEAWYAATEAAVARASSGRLVAR